VVIGARRDRLHVLNPVARFIREARWAGQPPASIAQSLSTRYGIPRKVARRDVNVALDEWQALESVSSKTAGHTAEVSPPANEPISQSVGMPVPKRRVLYRIADQPLVVRYGSPELYEAIHGLLEHLSVDALGVEPKAIDVWGKKDCWFVLNQGAVKMQSRSRDLAVLGVIREVAELAYRGRDWLTVCHAGGVVDGRQCIVMPAASGAGKSTLTAALSFSGWQVMGDDVVPVDRRTHEAVSVPIPFNLKPSSLPVLARLEARVSKAPGFERGDKRIHYLVPRQFTNNLPTVSYPVRLLVYHRYVPGAETALRSLSRVESLQRLIQSDCMLPQPLQDDLVEELVSWVGEVPAWELTYSALDEACDAMRGLRVS
jgi:hypothetical protein